VPVTPGSQHHDANIRMLPTIPRRNRVTVLARQRQVKKKNIRWFAGKRSIKLVCIMNASNTQPEKGK
jgi:hypothetical protein